MSLFSSLTTAVSGLAAQSKKISNVSTNLSNTSTTAYKAKDTSFEAMVDSSNASGGVRANTEYKNDVQGTVSSADVDTYLALSGNGYFAVKTAVKNADGTISFSSQTYYTRRGDFTVNSNGYLVNGTGYYLVGWQDNVSTGYVDTSTTEPIQISQLLDSPVKTSTVDYSANLPASATGGTTTSTSTIVMYDSLGTSHDLSYYWVKSTTNANEWTLNTSVADGSGTTGTAKTFSNTFTFDTDGSVSSSTSLSFAVNFPGAEAQTFISSFSGVTQYDDTKITVSSFTQNGIQRGSYSSVTIDQDGFVSINYDNGQSKTYYQVPVAIFNDENNIKELSGDAFQATTTSGNAKLCAPSTQGAGKIEASSLEESNVDIATEYSALIVSQQVYSANAKTISTVNDMLSTLLNIR